MKKKQQAIKRCLKFTPAFNYSHLKDQGFGFRSVQWVLKKGFLKRACRNIYYDPKLDLLPTFTKNCIIATSLYPNNPLCLRTALHIHRIDDNDPPSTINIAIFKGATIPRVRELPFKFRSFSEQSFNTGKCLINYHGYQIYIYNKEKTICDCFRFRRELGKDIVISAMKCYLRNSNKDMKLLLKYRDDQRMNSYLFNEWIVLAMSAV